MKSSEPKILLVNLRNLEISSHSLAFCLTQMLSERPKLYGVLVVLSAIGLKSFFYAAPLTQEGWPTLKVTVNINFLALL